MLLTSPLSSPLKNPVRDVFSPAGSSLSLTAQVQALFAASEPGAWYDPSDMSTMYQDAAGTLPCYMPGGGQVDPPVGRILDKSGRGNHASQATTTSRPTLSARYNLLTATDTLTTQSVTTVATSYTLKLTGAGSVTLSGTAAGSYSAGTYTITCTAGSLTLTVSGSVTQADLRIANDGVGLPEYQRVVDANTYDTAGFPLYLRFDGVDDFLDAGTLDFSAATQAAAVIGIKKVSDAISASPYSHGLASQNGAFRFLAPANPAQASVRAASRGADGGAQETVGTNDKAAPIKLVLCSTYGANAPVSIRYNGTESRVSSGSLGALTLPSARSVIGARVMGETTQSSFFLGHIYGLVHIARSLSLGEQQHMEQFMRNKSMAY